MGRAVSGLFERFDIEPSSDFSAKSMKLSNFIGLVLLYRRQILQENIRWKALDEIYKIYMILHRSNLNISEKNRQTFSHFSAFFAKNRYFRILLIEFCSDFDEIVSELRRYFRKIQC